MELQEKTCARCHLAFPIESFSIRKNNGRPSSHCPSCTKILKKESRLRCKETISEKQKQWRLAHQETLKAYQKEYREKNKEQLHEKKAERYQKNKEQRQAKCREYYRKNTEKILEQKKQYAKDNAEKIRERQKRYFSSEGYKAKRRKNYRDFLAALSEPERKEFIEKRRQDFRLYRDKNVQKIRMMLKKSDQKRRAVERNAIIEPFDLTKHEHHLTVWQCHRCFHCNTILDEASGMHLDHIVPLSRNGKHCASNIVLSCSFCNKSKNDRILGWEWTSPLFSPIENIFLPVPDLDPAVRIISTFLCSERNHPAFSTILRTSREEHPEALFFFDFEWEQKKPAILNIIRGHHPEYAALAARKTQCRFISNDQARTFLDQFHLYGYTPASVYVALIHDDNIVAVSSWTFHQDFSELSRLAFDGRIMGGLGKMVSAFLSEYPSPLMTYADPRFSTGRGYEKIGFRKLPDTRMPKYGYINPNGYVSRQYLMKKNQEKVLSLFDPKRSEPENANANGYHRIVEFPQMKFQLDP